MRKFAFILCALIIGPIMVHNSFAELIIDTEYPKRIDIIIAMQEKPSPRQQLSDGVFAADVVCSNDFVLVLKLSANNEVACVSFHTADKLVERKWGVIRTDKTILGGIYGGCRDHFEIFYDTVANYRESQLLKQMRMTLSEFSNEVALWSTIQVSSPSNEGSVRISVNSCFGSDNETSKILNDFKELEHVKDAKVGPRAI